MKGPVKVHIGGDPEFRPVRKAHPGLEVNGFEAMCTQLQAAGFALRPDNDLPGVRLCYVEDPFGNSIELIEG